jgi:hypothetical protein
MNNWLKFNKAKQVDLFNQLSSITGILPQAIEKDAWVCLILRILFSSRLKKHIIFKGGTSLSKAYKLIKRFSEDIDISLDRKYLGFIGDLSKGEIRKLRRSSHSFVSEKMPYLLKEELDNFEVEPNLYSIIVENSKISDQDPEIIQINYTSVFEEAPYITSKVLIEIGARSLMDFYEKKNIQSIIDENYPNTSFFEGQFEVNTTIPEKTFLEKLILLHEEFKKPTDKIRFQRMSRHLYDIGQISNTDFGKKALKNHKLFNKIIDHRKKFTPLKIVNYDALSIDQLEIIPPGEVFQLYKKDYMEMQDSMIYGESMDFRILIEQISKILK